MTSSETAGLQYAVERGVAWISLNRPEARNALDRELRRALVAAVKQAARDRAARVIVIGGEGPAFCAGADVREMAGEDREPLEVVRADYEALLTQLRTTPKPTIAAIRGAAAGIGVSIALSCDLRYATPDAFLREAFVDIGLTVDGGATWLLPRLVGSARALELFYTGRRLPAEEAERWGVVNAIVPPDELEARVRTVASQLARGPAAALGAIKRSVAYAETSTFEEALDFEFLLQGVQFTGSDFKEGTTAFLEKRRPHFS
ncbi:MAG: enoyl-CoA hydratase-related protein [Candidatus Dormiibacterota bacterium]